MTNTTTTTTKTTKYFDFDKITIDDALTVVNETMHELTGDILAECINAIKTELKNINAGKKAEKINDLLSYGDRTDFLMDEYIDEPFYPTFVLKQAKDTHLYSIANQKKMLDFVSLDNAYKKEYKKHLCYDTDFWRLNCRFARDVVRYITKSANAAGTPSMNSLEKSLIAVTVALLGDKAPKMLKCDVKAISYACIKNKFMQFTTANEKDFLKYVVLAIRTRKAGGKYEFTNKFKYDENGKKAAKKS